MAEIDSTDEGRVDLKKRARRRLVGAVALALLAVIVLPMVMDEEPKPLTQDIQIRIPSQDSPALVPRVAAPAPPAKPVAAPEVKAEVKAEPVAELKTEPKVESKPEPVAKPAKAVEEVKAPASAEPKPEAKAEKAAAKAETKQQWVVQLGAYQELGNVKLILAKVKELGYPAYTEKVDTAQGTRTRVRAGPFATREKAERAQAALKRIAAGGPSGGVVAPK